MAQPVRSGTSFQPPPETPLSRAHWSRSPYLPDRITQAPATATSRTPFCAKLSASDRTPQHPCLGPQYRFTLANRTAPIGPVPARPRISWKRTLCINYKPMPSWRLSADPGSALSLMTSPLDLAVLRAMSCTPRTVGGSRACSTRGTLTAALLSRSCSSKRSMNRTCGSGPIVARKDTPGSVAEHACRVANPVDRHGRG